MDTKSVFRSTTFWINTAFLAGSIAELIVGNPSILEGYGVSPTAAAAILAVANILLRFKTKRPVSLNG